MDQTDERTDPRFSPQDAAVPAPPELDIGIDDKKLVKFIEAYEKKAKLAEKDIHLKKRRKRNERFFFGRQIDGNTYHGIHGKRGIKTYEKPFLDNVIKEGEDILRPMVLSRLPDLIVKPGTESDPSKESAEQISEVVNKTLHSRELKKILAKSFRHHPIYFIGVIKWRWDPQKGRFGDIRFEAIHPKNIRFDFTATRNDQEDMRLIIHYVEKPIKDWITMFPTKEKILTDYAKKKGKFTGDLDEESMAVNLKLPEVWFDWSEKADDFDPENPIFDFKSGVCWKAGKEILDKRLDPKWDWDGQEEMFFNGHPIPDELMTQIIALGVDVPGIERKTVFRNFFGRPRKPFIFVGYDQYGEMALDETTRIEENLYLQQNYDVRGMQITKMIDDSRGKHAFSSLSGLKRKTVEAMDLSDPDEDIFLDGDLREMHSFISKEQPGAAMFGDLERSRERILARVHVHGPTRGEIESDVATTNQIARESDFTVADDIADDTVNEVTTQMAEALLHIIKLRYTEDHFRAILGEKGDFSFTRFTNDMIEDGMEIEIFASGTDKLKAERQAKDEAALGLIDPLTYYKDTGRSDPEGRAEKLFLFQTQPELYFKKFVRGDEVPDIAEQVGLMNQQNLAQVQGQPQQPSPQNTGNIPTTPRGSPRNLIGKAGAAITGLFGR